MGVIDTFSALADQGFSNAIIVLLLLILFACFIVELGKRFLEHFGLEFKATRLMRERDERIKKAEDKVKELEQLNTILKNNFKDATDRLEQAEREIISLEASADKFNNDRINDRDTSIHIRNEINKNIKDIVGKVDGLVSTVNDLKEQNRKYELDDIRETLLQSYRYYTNPNVNPLKQWTSMEAHAFKEQYKNYEDRGGNDYMHEVVHPEMEKLVEIPMNDYEKISNLMLSRNQKGC